MARSKKKTTRKARSRSKADSGAVRLPEGPLETFPVITPVAPGETHLASRPTIAPSEGKPSKRRATKKVKRTPRRTARKAAGKAAGKGKGKHQPATGKAGVGQVGSKPADSATPADTAEKPVIQKKERRLGATSEARRAPEKPARAAAKGAGRPPHIPTDRDRLRVMKAVGLGLNQDEICQLVIDTRSGKSISPKTLRQCYREELDRGMPEMKRKVGKSLVKRALDHKHPQGATCAIFYLKTRAGWQEKVAIEATVKSGVLIAPASASPEEWIRESMERNAEAVEPGTGEGE